MTDFTRLIAEAETAGHGVWTGGAQPEAAVLQLEAALGVRLPPSYRNFVLCFGGMNIDGLSISGILDGKPTERLTGWLFGDTMRFREVQHGPDHLLVFQPDDEAPYCFDSSQPDGIGEFPVVCFELHSKHACQVARTFGDWAEDFAFGAANGAG